MEILGHQQPPSTQGHYVGDRKSVVGLRCGSEISHLNTEHRKFAEAKKWSYDIKEPWLKKTMKKINNLINNQTFPVEYPEKDEPVTPCMDFYKAKIQSNGSLDKLKLIIVAI